MPQKNRRLAVAMAIMLLAVAGRAPPVPN